MTSVISRMLALLFLATIVLVAQQSQSPSLETSQRNEQPQYAQGQPDILVGTEATPAVVRIAKSQEETSQEQAERGRQAEADRWNIWLTSTIAVFTLALVYVGWKQRQTYEATLATNKDIERAYVTMSHFPPGIHVHSERVLGDYAPVRWKHKITLKIKVQNYGNTPARVTRGLVQVILTNATFPATPSYAEELARPGRVILVKGDSYTITTPYEFESTGDKAFADAFWEIGEHGHRLYVIGYVDYIDKFDRRHRAGYARQYEPDEDRTGPYMRQQYPPHPILGDKFLDHEAYARRNNLVYITQPGYNYDRERTRSEGNDWDET